mmetsp:Transcript_9325/g.10371  ORF Transcript_9325/g.10371 Transcript_9325/m.10371 type:complete len:202 (-) Transcript_9325:84-689(-)
MASASCNLFIFSSIIFISPSFDLIIFLKRIISFFRLLFCNCSLSRATANFFLSCLRILIFAFFCSTKSVFLFMNDSSPLSLSLEEWAVPLLLTPLPPPLASPGSPLSPLPPGPLLPLFLLSSSTVDKKAVVVAIAAMAGKIVVAVAVAVTVAEVLTTFWFLLLRLLAVVGIDDRLLLLLFFSLLLLSPPILVFDEHDDDIF